MFLKDRIKLFARLGERLKNLTKDEMQGLSAAAGNENAWFTQDSVENALIGVSRFLNEATLTTWTEKYQIDARAPKKVGIITAGNIPLVGFHDLLSVLISGHYLLIKPSSDDSVLIKFVLNELVAIVPEMASHFEIVERLNMADAFIATGSDNSARYFKYYFKDKPNIIRANRTSVAVLSGEETVDQVKSLGNDIFQYYGLGCRNVSKLLVPANYDFTAFLDALQEFSEVGNHHKYRNNYDYNKSIYLVNREPHLDTEFMLLRESEDLVSPISVLYYQYYADQNELNQLLKSNESKIQCIVGDGYVPFGAAQSPEVWDYADGVDTLDFLQKL